MKIDVTPVLKDLDGSDLRDGDKSVTFRMVCINALNNQLRGDENLTGEQKFKMFLLASKIHDEMAPDLSVEDLATIKDRVGRAYVPVIVGRVYAHIEARTAAAANAEAA